MLAFLDRPDIAGGEALTGLLRAGNAGSNTAVDHITVLILAATDLVVWAQLIGFIDHPELARCEIAAFHYRVLHMAARITRGARQLRLRIDATWRWAPAIATAWQRIRTAFG